MWQILLVIYIVAVVLSAVILWASLIVAKRAEQNTESRLPFKQNSGINRKSTLTENRAVKMPAMKQYFEK